MRGQGNCNTPIVYVHFLLFHCHYYQCNTKHCMHSLRNLQLTIDKKTFITNYYQEAFSYNMLGRTFQLIGDTESARHGFLKSLELCSDPNENDATIRLAAW